MYKLTNNKTGEVFTANNIKDLVEKSGASYSTVAKLSTGERKSRQYTFEEIKEPQKTFSKLSNETLYAIFQKLKNERYQQIEEVKRQFADKIILTAMVTLKKKQLQEIEYEGRKFVWNFLNMNYSLKK